MSNEITAVEFQVMLVKRLRDSGLRVEELGAMQLRLGEQKNVFYLDNMFQQYKSGALLGDLVKAISKTLAETEEALTSAERPLDLDKVMPMLKPRAFLNEVKRTQVDAIAWQPFITDELIVTLVIDMPNSLRYVKDSELAALGRDFDEVLEIALGNLWEHSGGNAYQLGDDEHGRMFVLATQDGYDATRILLSPLLEQLAGQVKGELVIGVPNRDFFIAFGNANPMMVGQIGRQVKQDAQTRTYPLTATLFTFQDGELKVYEG